MKRRDTFKAFAGFFAFLAANRFVKADVAQKPLPLEVGRGTAPTTDVTLLAMGAHSVRVYVPKPFEFINIAGQTTFPCYSSIGVPTTRAAAYLFPCKEYMVKVEGMALATPPISGYSLCSHRGVRYAVIAVGKQVEEFNQEAAERQMQSVTDQAIESLKNFHVVTPGDMTHIWPKETREEREHRERG